MNHALGHGEVPMRGIRHGKAGNERRERTEERNRRDVAVLDLHLAAARHRFHPADCAREMSFAPSGRRSIFRNARSAP